MHEHVNKDANKSKETTHMAQSKESEQAQKRQSMLSHKDKTIHVIRHIQG